MLLSLRQINLKNLMTQESKKKYMDFKDEKGIVQAVHEDYIKQFFSGYEIKELMNDVEDSKLDILEPSILKYLGLEDDTKSLCELQKRFSIGSKTHLRSVQAYE